MKTFITIWILLRISLFAQTECEDFKVLLKEVDKNYSELSQNPFPGYLKFTLIHNDTLKTKLYNVKGEIVYQNKLGLLKEGIYIVKFISPKCSGVYFASLEIGNQPTFKQAIQITSELFPINAMETNTAVTVIDGVWKRSYSKNFIPPIQFDSEEYHYKYDLQLQFSKGFYKIISERTDDYNGKDIKTFEGRFTLKGDTLKLYEDSKLQKLFQYKIVKDTLSVSFFEIIDKVTGAISIPVSYNTEIRLDGKYHK